MIHPLYGCVVVYPPAVGVKMHRRALHDASRRAFDERLYRLDPFLWAPPMEMAKLPRRAVDEQYDTWRTGNRPFRRAFPGGESRRRVLMAAGLAMAAERNRKAAGL